MQKVQLADRLGNIQNKKIGFSWCHLFLGPFYCCFKLDFLLALLEIIGIYYLLPIPGMNFITGWISGLSFLPSQVSSVICNVLNLFRSNVIMYYLGGALVLIFHIYFSFIVSPKALKRYIKRKELRPYDEKDARILIKWRAVKDNVGLAESFDIRETNKYKAAEENWYENNQVRIKNRPSFATRSNTLKYTREQKIKIQDEQLDNLYKLGLINRDEYIAKKSEIIKRTIVDK